MALNARQWAFVNVYLETFNATAAAREAGYSVRSAASIGSENLRKPEIEAEIQHRLQATAMSADEVLMRLAAQARGTLADFLTEENQLDLAKGRAAQQLHLLKKVKQRRQLRRTEEEGVLETMETEFELYDAQRALEVLAKAHGLLKESVDLRSDQSMKITLTWGDDNAADDGEAAGAA
jgi:phage terminase small subunit